MGVTLLSFLLAIFTMKSLQAPLNTVVFSKHAYYCRDDKFFLIIFINTCHINLANVEISSYFKLGGNWVVRHSITSPLITRSAQTFHINKFEEKDIVKYLREGDCLRVGMTGQLGFANFSTSIQYNSDEILVIPNRRELVDFFEPRSAPNDFKAPEFHQMFHNYCPHGAITLPEFVAQQRETSRASQQSPWRRRSLPGRQGQSSPPILV